jgi:hypothetical protein
MYTNSQLTGPGNSGDILYFMRVMLFIGFLSMGYKLSQPRPAAGKKQDVLSPDTVGAISQGQEWADIPPWQRQASEKAVARYAESQNKKWRRWNEVMFERSA